MAAFFTRLSRQISHCSIVVGLLCLPLAAAPAALGQQEAMPRVLSVRGQGIVSVPTVNVRVRLGVEVDLGTAQAAQAEAARRSTAVVELLRARQVEELETTGIRLQPRFNFENRVRRLVGYQAINILNFQVETERAGELLDAAIAAGATRIDSVAFTASEEELAQARQQALQEAVRDAQQQARTVLSALGFSAEEIVGVEIISPNAPAPVPLERSALQAEAASTTPVIGGEQAVRASVMLRIRY